MTSSPKSGLHFSRRVVLRGNHHDAWVNGAEDPTPHGRGAGRGRAMGELLKAGWKPKRTIILCAWMGKSGLAGLDGMGGGTLRRIAPPMPCLYQLGFKRSRLLEMEGSHSLEKFSNEIARDVSDPETKLSVWKRARLKAIEDAKSTEDRDKIRQRADTRIGPLVPVQTTPPFYNMMASLL